MSRMSLAILPPPASVTRVLIWHQGALGDLLLAGPALAAISSHFPRARFTALGHPERWGLLSGSLPLDDLWDSGQSQWVPLFSEGPLPAGLVERLARFQLTLIFSPNLQPALLSRLHQAGIPAVHWLPSFPASGTDAVADLQARHLGELGLPYRPTFFKLAVADNPESEELPGPGPWLALAPGSGQARKNWPLSSYYEVSRALAWEFRLKVVWLAGPAEEAVLPYLQALARAQGQILLANRSLSQVAWVLSRCRLYLGNDSGLTHLAAAVAGPDVLSLFGPTDPRVWAPLGPRVHALTAPCPQAPCAVGRTIPCPESRCLEDLTPDTVLAAAARLLKAPDHSSTRES
jgi:heptosyltransferase III